jgi:hypothetical protein
MHSYHSRMIRATVAALALAFVQATTASAQWSAGAFGVAEVDTDETLLLLAGISATPGGLGWAPILGIQGYHLSFDAGSSRTNVFTYKPYAGLRYGVSGGAVSATLGYSISNSDAVRPAGAIVSESGDGLVLSGGYDFWGTGGPWAYQALGSYGFESESFWARARATRMLSTSSSGTGMRAGAELAYLNGRGYGAYQPGALLQWQLASGRSIGIGAGAKFYEGGGNAAYFKLEGYLPVTGR